VKIKKETRNVDVIVKSGRVAFYREYSLHSNSIMTPGMKGDYIASENRIVFSTNKNQNFLSWQTGILTFYDTPINEVCLELSEHYKRKVKAITEDTALTLTGSFQNESLEDILKTIEITLDINITVTKGNVLIHN
jgi:ferric-dicitrate binding protein FerR (iron transport regulator)